MSHRASDGKYSNRLELIVHTQRFKTLYKLLCESIELSSDYYSHSRERVKAESITCVMLEDYISEGLTDHFERRIISQGG